MIKDTISQIERRIREARSIQEVRKDELLTLVSRLRDEVEDLSETHDEEARSIANDCAGAVTIEL